MANLFTLIKEKLMGCCGSARIRMQQRKAGVAPIVEQQEEDTSQVVAQESGEYVIGYDETYQGYRIPGSIPNPQTRGNRASVVIKNK